jgi:hypothetical protein
LFDDSVQRSIFVRKVWTCSDSIFGFEPHGCNWVTDFVRDSRDNPPKRCEALDFRHLVRQRLC